jgi:hypothetical protein
MPIQRGFLFSIHDANGKRIRMCAYAKDMQMREIIEVVSAVYSDPFPLFTCRGPINGRQREHLRKLSKMTICKV